MESSSSGKWVAVYPVYINSKKTLAEGRRIGISHACENPTIAEIGDCCVQLKLPCSLEPDKAYSRDYMERGRVKVQLKQNDSLINPNVPSKRVLMLKVAELVQHQAPRRRLDTGASSSKAAPASAAPSSSSAPRGGKSGKRRR